MAGSVIQGNKVTVKSVVADVAGGVLGRGISNKITANAKGTPEARQLARSAKRAANVAVGSRPTRAAAAAVLAKEAADIGVVKGAVAGAVGSNSASKVINPPTLPKGQ